MFKDFDRRLERDIKKRVASRHKTIQSTSGDVKSQPIDVKVVSHSLQRYAVWFGGSMFASNPEFPSLCHTKEKYQEYGPSICRYNPVFVYSP